MNICDCKDARKRGLSSRVRLLAAWLCGLQLSCWRAGGAKSGSGCCCDSLLKRSVMSSKDDPPSLERQMRLCSVTMKTFCAYVQIRGKGVSGMTPDCCLHRRVICRRLRNLPRCAACCAARCAGLRRPPAARSCLRSAALAPVQARSALPAACQRRAEAARNARCAASARTRSSAPTHSTPVTLLSNLLCGAGGRMREAMPSSLGRAHGHGSHPAARAPA